MALVAALAILAGASCAGGSGSSDADQPEANEPDPSAAGPRVSAFLDATEDPVLAELCAYFTTDFLQRLAPPDGTCRDAMRTLTTLTGGGEANTLPSKTVDEVVSDGDLAVVTVVDRIEGDDPLAFRLRWQRDEWLLDEIGTGAENTAACIVEAQALRDAVDRYLDNNALYPADARSLVPSYLPEAPTGHEVGPDGQVVPVGDCAR